MALMTLNNELIDLKDKLEVFSKPDENGYYPVVLGAFNVYASNGAFYKITENLVRLFGPEAYINMKAKNGQLKAEAEHPKFVKGMTKEEWLQRLAMTDEKYTCGLFGEVKLDDVPRRLTTQKGEAYLTLGKIKPIGKYGDALKSDLETPDSNTSFSIRALSNRNVIAGIDVREIFAIYGWDWTNRGAISGAGTRTLVELQSYGLQVTTEELSAMITHLEQTSNPEELLSCQYDLEVTKHAIKRCSGGVCITKDW